VSYEEFVHDKKTTNAVMRSVETIGEAAKHVSEQIRCRRPDVPWKDMARMRDRCIHGYFGVDYEMVWNVVKKDIPRIRPMIDSLLDELRASDKK